MAHREVLTCGVCRGLVRNRIPRGADRGVDRRLLESHLVCCVLGLRRGELVAAGRRELLDEARP